MILYDLDHSPFAARVRIAIRAKNLDVALQAPPADYRRINPLGLVPSLVTEDGTTLIESEAIVEYLEDRFPTPALRPDGAKDRAFARIVARLCDLRLCSRRRSTRATTPSIRASSPRSAFISRRSRDTSASVRSPWATACRPPIAPWRRCFSSSSAARI
jgi:glutathione S-transferase